MYRNWRDIVEEITAHADKMDIHVTTDKPDSRVNGDEMDIVDSGGGDVYKRVERRWPLLWD
jgi:hypothetical protein